MNGVEPFYVDNRLPPALSDAVGHAKGECIWLYYARDARKYVTSFTEAVVSVKWLPIKVVPDDSHLYSV